MGDWRRWGGITYGKEGGCPLCGRVIVNGNIAWEVGGQCSVGCYQACAVLMLNCPMSREPRSVLRVQMLNLRSIEEGMLMPPCHLL